MYWFSVIKCKDSGFEGIHKEEELVEEITIFGETNKSQDYDKVYLRRMWLGIRP